MEAVEVNTGSLLKTWPRIVLIVGFASVSGCRQVPVSVSDQPEGVDGTFAAEATDDTVPIEKELAAPKGFFNRNGGPTAGWSSQARDIERSLGVGRK